MSLIAELKRRNVIRMAGLYLVGAWLIVQVAETLLPLYDTPGWVLKSLILLLALGFIPALVFSWVFELTPDGLKRDGDVTPGQSIAPRTARRMDQLTLAGVLVLLAVIAADRFWPRNTPPMTDAGIPAVVSATAGEGADADAARATAAPVAPTVSSKSIAVLPFADLSPERDQEYFSDGMSEEILNALAQVKDLKVAGRTSSFYFKGKDQNLQAIGSALGVAHILEGSVRKQGDRVRITAQLIQVADGFHLWSETYDGDLSDVFELQERIARAITDKLQVILQGDQEQRLVPVATESAEAYALYLQATAIFNRREGPKFADAIGMLEEALRLDPKFARAHARLGALHALAPQYASADLNLSIAAASEHANAAMALNPNLAEAHAVLAQSQVNARQYIASRASYERALSIDPDDVLTNFWMATNLISTGYLERGDELLDHVLAIDPLLPNALMWRGTRHVFTGDSGEGERMLRRADELGISNVGVGLTHLEEQRGNTPEAIEQLARGLKVFMSAFPTGASRIVAEGTFGNAPQRAAAVRMIEDYLARNPAVIAGAAPYALIRLGQPQRAFEVMVDAPTDSDAVVYFLLWSPQGAEARKLPEFSQFARDVGLAAAWDALGPPDTCRKQAGGEYHCD